MLDELRRLIAEQVASGTAKVGGPIEEHDLGAPERTLGRFPADYRAFVAEFGWLEARGVEVYGAGKDVPRRLDVVRQTASEQEGEPGLPAGYIAIVPDGAGNVWCVRAGDDSPVFLRDHESYESEGDLEREADGFAAFLLERLRPAPVRERVAGGGPLARQRASGGRNVDGRRSRLRDSHAGCGGRARPVPDGLPRFRLGVRLARGAWRPRLHGARARHRHSTRRRRRSVDAR